MRRSLAAPFALVVFLAASAGAPGQPEKKDEPKAKTGLRKGGNIPGPFHPYNLNGRRADHYHCPITEHDLGPVALVFTRDLEVGDALKSLVAKLDNAAVKNPLINLYVTVVFV